MRKKKHANDPLMYIQQPSIKRSVANMQHQYTTTKKQTTQPKENHDEKPIPKRPIGNKYVQQLNSQKPIEKVNKPKNETIQEKDQVTDEENENKDRPKFKDMSIREKVEYFAEKPKHLPKKKCEVKTSQRSYRGIVHEFQDDVVRMVVGRRIVSLQLDDIKDIKMLGL